MGFSRYISVGFICVILLCGAVLGVEGWGFDLVSDSYTLGESFKVTVKVQHDEVSARGGSAIALNFEAFGKWHFYADNSLIPGGMLVVKVEGEGLTFGEVVFPASHLVEDKILEKSYDVYDGMFTVFVPFTVDEGVADGKIPVTVEIGGAVCAEMCKFIKDAKVVTDVTVAASASMAKPNFTVSDVVEAGDDKPVLKGREKGFLSVPAALSLAILAGLLLNVMPCVWPIIPIVVTRLWNVAGESRKKCAGMGAAFCFGILLFFAVLAGANIVLRVGYNEFFQWGDHYRNPMFVTAMSLMLMVLALFMFGVFNFTLPSSVSSKAGGGGDGVAGTIGMGFLLALLSTPCSFAILGAVFLWAQTQEIGLATLAIMLIGVGMAIPYLVLTCVEGLLDKLPRSGVWMERVKQAMGFLLLIIAVKLFSAIPSKARVDTLYYAVILAFCCWMWGGWVTFSTSRGRKWLIRLISVALAVGGGWFFLGVSAEKPIDWQGYDGAAIEKAVEDGKPVVIKFTADWCTSCSVVERMVYMRKDVGELFKQKGVVAFIGDTTSADDPATKDLAEKYFELGGVPVSIILLPDGEQVHLPGMIGKDDVVEALAGLSDVLKDQ